MIQATPFCPTCGTLKCRNHGPQAEERKRRAEFTSIGSSTMMSAPKFGASGAD